MCGNVCGHVCGNVVVQCDNVVGVNVVCWVSDIITLHYHITTQIPHYHTNVVCGVNDVCCVSVVVSSGVRSSAYCCVCVCVVIVCVVSVTSGVRSCWYCCACVGGSSCVCGNGVCAVMW